jgi:flagellum-specific peptidoglycan hydrolase FlgJ
VLSTAQQAALQRIAAAAVDSEATTGVPAALTAAQCIFESGWLERCPGNNAFGIKRDHHGSGCQYVLTHEFLNGQWETMPLAFETYRTLADCFADHARLIQSGVYAPAWARFMANRDLDAYIAGVARFYATDPEYREKITAEAHSATVVNALRAARALPVLAPAS